MPSDFAPVSRVSALRLKYIQTFPCMQCLHRLFPLPGMLFPKMSMWLLRLTLWVSAQCHLFKSLPWWFDLKSQISPFLTSQVLITLYAKTRFFTVNPFPNHLAHLPTSSLVFPQCQVTTMKADLVSILSTPWDRAWHIVGAQIICWMNEWMDTQLRWSLETGRKGPQRHTDRASGRCMGSVQWVGCWSWSHSWGIHSGQGNGSSCLLSWCLWRKRGKKKGPRTHD